MRGVAVTLAGFAFIALLLAWSRWLTRHRLAAVANLALATIAAIVAAALWSVATGLEDYEPLRAETVVAEVRFDETGTDRYRATFMHLPEGGVQVFEMPGNRWRLAARTLEWHGFAADAGLKPMFRFEALEAGTATTDGEGVRVLRTYQLAEPDSLDVWAWVRASRAWSRYAVAGRADGAWLPVSRGEHFVVRIADGVLRIEPAAGPTPTLATSR
ncbi:MAG TPA: hypothetical protein PK163_07070 [Steroidobacteraceae bacterium]|nr:hypothetical protein [Steroidobacteraceae bacterium]